MASRAQGTVDGRWEPALAGLAAELLRGVAVPFLREQHGRDERPAQRRRGGGPQRGGGDVEERHGRRKKLWCARLGSGSKVVGWKSDETATCDDFLTRPRAGTVHDEIMHEIQLSRENPRCRQRPYL
jgi:hypothetical protein